METLTTREAAERIGVPVSTLHNWVTAQRITPIKRLPGQRGALLFALEDVDRLRGEHIAQLRSQLAAAEAAS